MSASTMPPRGEHEHEHEHKHEQEQALTSVQQFYHGKHVLITGGTGFLGRILLEKLLRSCPGLEAVYLLVRRKRGLDVYTRLEEMLDDPMFGRLKEEVPKFRHKVVVVPADCEAAGLGLSIGDRLMIIEKVNIIFHAAATVRFDEPLRAALGTNVRAPLQLLRLARDLRRLTVLMHISTAYSNSHLTRIEERFYPCPADLEHLEQLVAKLTDPQVEAMQHTVLGAWPNTYTFSKALAEKELRAHAAGLPVGIFRPAIVISTAREPLKCWVNNMYGPTGVAVGSATGMLRSLQCDPGVAADVVPADAAVNCLLVAASRVGRAFAASPPPEPPVFNYVSSVENRITWGDFMQQNMARIDRNPFSDAVWYFSLQLTRSALMNRINILVLHLLPAAMVDGLACCLGRTPKMLKVYKKIHKFSSVLAYFTTRDIQFCNKRTRQLWEDTSPQDREIFPFSMKDVQWAEYFDGYLIGIRRYLFKESDDSLPRARVKWRRLYYLHQIARVLLLLLAAYALWSLAALVARLW